MEGRIRVGLDECTVRDHVSFPSLSLRRVVRVPSIMIPFHMLLIALDVLMGPTRCLCSTHDSCNNISLR
jgi:hypothetical protein